MPTFVGKEYEMMGYGKTLLAVASAAVVCMASQATQAAPVQYSTAGTFTGTGPPLVNTVTVGGFTVTYNAAVANATPATAVTPPTSVDFGSFTVTSVGLPPTSGTFSNSFNFSISQLAPGVGSTGSTGGLAGTLTATSSSLQLTFASPTVGSIVAGGFSTNYFISSSFFNPLTASSSVGLMLSPGANNSLDGFVTQTGSGGSVPLPPAAVAGCALLGSLGMTRVRRRFTKVVA